SFALALLSFDAQLFRFGVSHDLRPSQDTSDRGGLDRTRPAGSASGAVETRTIPATEICGGSIRALQEGHEPRIGIGGATHRLVGQHELTEPRVEIRRVGLYGGIGEAGRRRI